MVVAGLGFGAQLAWVSLEEWRAVREGAKKEEEFARVLADFKWHVKLSTLRGEYTWCRVYGSAPTGSAEQRKWCWEARRITYMPRTRVALAKERQDSAQAEVQREARLREARKLCYDEARRQHYVRTGRLASRQEDYTILHADFTRCDGSFPDQDVLKAQKRLEQLRSELAQDTQARGH